MDITREDVLAALAKLMEEEARVGDAEPYRNAGDRIVDEALDLID